MAVSDLTGTKWLLNSVPTASPNAQCRITGRVPGVAGFMFMRKNPGSGLTAVVTFSAGSNGSSSCVFYSNSTTALYGVGWYVKSSGTTGATFTLLTEPPTIIITGGNDVTTQAAITWFEENATQLPGEISIGTSKLASAFIGNTELASMWLGNVKLWEKSSPTPDDIAQFIEIGNPTGAYENEYADSPNETPYTFNSCNNITSLSLPNERVFQIDGASSLTSLSLPKCYIIEKIANVPNLATLYVGTEYAGTTVASNLSLPSTIKIYVPSARANDYKSASGWSSYADNIYGV